MSAATKPRMRAIFARDLQERFGSQDPDGHLLVSVGDIAVELHPGIGARETSAEHGQVWARWGKRAFDVAAALLALVVLMPVLAVIALSVLATSGRPVLYGHHRVGRYNRTFTCWKFRTMRRDADRVLDDVLAQDPVLRQEYELTQKLQADPRVTRIGRLLRRTSLDELPQLWNVLRGHMSIVGPRPVVPDETQRYGDLWPVVAGVRPGLTGLWQVSGRSNVSYPERVRLDYRYAKAPTFRGDLGLIVRTVPALLRPEEHGAC